ncbi:MAG: hypothetical protein K0R18_1745 [Bacillales bacterium]|jgi:L-ascorbate metabolism protein UlaG (beta-lactamase superfamily)|nr:hypothetical protein [Bacillales bacterium]
MWLLIALLAVFLFLTFIFVRHKKLPQFGAKPTGEGLRRIKQSKNFHHGKFRNRTNTEITRKFKVKSMLNFSADCDATPKTPLPFKNSKSNDYSDNGAIKFTWFGHSAVLLEVNQMKILLDPMLTNIPAPIKNNLMKRFPTEQPIEIDKLPELDIVLISHDHYDHLDFKTIVQIKDKVKMFVVPLGVGAHLKRWGVIPSKIIEQDWWEERKVDCIQFIAAPSHHYSGRSVFDRNRTLWCSWIIKTNEFNIYFSGDSGYRSTFKEIGSKYGPFDLTFLECGQYHEERAEFHMLPEQTVQAHLDLKGKFLMPIHWGAFNLSKHSWYESAERITTAAEEHHVNLITPKLGEMVEIGIDKSFSRWWREVQ